MMTSPETWKVLFDYSLGVVLAFFSFMSAWFFKKINNTYTKDEVEHLMDLKIVPLVNALNNNSKSIDRQTIVLDKLNDSMNVIHQDSISTKLKVEELERRAERRG